MPTPDLSGLKIVVDVQHLYRDGIHLGDRGSIYTLADGTHVTEADSALHYAIVLCARLEQWGARVATNEPRSGILVGDYWRRQHAAMAFGADAYLACHLNAGRGSYAACEYADGGIGAGMGNAIVRELQTSVAEIHDGRVVALKSGDRGLVCVREFVRGPAVIVEPFFGDNPMQQPLLSLQGLGSVGEAIARGVANWWRASRMSLPVA